MVTAAARPHVYWIPEARESRKRVRAWPVGPALLEALSNVNADVYDALQDERTRLGEHGYPEDLPLPALWWTPPVAATEQD